ncbi:plasmid partitioning protein RepB [Paracoccus laeviglucosivorans]|uniref:Chromosome partitioning protein, ParB family n=1 Tax=Paracoccus laeviglucosivorans TaxID=1197861 RepID=A0A521FC23_9RHOB|nr:plasmid partitioning protein RepB [Paracoccus laeviglucosivorans]SMO93747.1 chromosome partitioning protein, ParB family [Paracoccus laeviglucosivorans]
MSDGKKRRMSMLDNMAGAAPAAPMMANRALRSARDAVDTHRIWDLDPDTITDDRSADRLDPADVADLRASIEAVGQTVPILVRRDPVRADRYQLVYGRRRLEAVRGSSHVGKVRAMIAAMDDRAAIMAQASENTGRRDLSFIEKALFAQELMDTDFGTQAEVAEVLNLTKSAISMALSVSRAVGRDLASAIGPAHGIGRPRWESLVKDLQASPLPQPELIDLAMQTRANTAADVADPSVAAFDAVSLRLRKALMLPTPRRETRKVTLDQDSVARLTRTKDGLRLDLQTTDENWAEWLLEHAGPALEELHARYKRR